MVSARNYKISIALLLAVLAVSSSLSVYFYQARANMNNQISTLNGQISDLKNQVNSAQASSNQNGLEARVTVLENELLQLNATINQLQATTKTQGNEIDALKAQIQDLQNQINNLQPVTLNGAGATFPYPFLSAVFIDYSILHPNVQINYNAIGSGAGVLDLTQKLVDFAATDRPLTDAQRSAAPNVVHIPETIGGVAVAYNVPGISTGLHLNATVISAIFQGNITMWNDPLLAQLNPTLTLPNSAITVVHRSDSAGTTFVFTNYLQSSATAGPDAWKLGANTVVAWPGGTVGGSGNAGVAAIVQGTQYSIGYVELNYALPNHMSIASIRNSDDSNYVAPSLASVTYAVQNSTQTNTLPPGDASWSTLSLLNAPGQNSYPIVSFTYLIVYKELNVLPGINLHTAQALVDVLWFLIHDGQVLAPPLAYPSLPSAVVNVDEATIGSITFNGQVLHPP